MSRFPDNRGMVRASSEVTFPSEAGTAPTMARTLLAALALPLMVAACQSAGDADLGAAATPADAAVLTISAAGVPGLPAGSPYSEAAIEQRMPGFDASSVMMATETSTPSALALFKDGLQVVQVLPGPGRTVGAIHGVSTRLRGPAGEHIGMSLREAGIDPATCRIGTGNWLGMPICKSRAASNVTLVFATTGPAEGADALSAATLERIIWVPAEAASS